MLKSYLIPILIGTFLVAFSTSNTIESFSTELITDIDNQEVDEVLFSLGEKTPLHYSYKKNRLDSIKVKRGFEIITKGQTESPSGKLSKRQSKHFVCIDCHNVVKEDPDLSVSDPEARLTYAAEKDIPFLQGTTFYGMVNREHWYNQDYQIKYGDMVLPSRDTLLNAIYLCSVECSQGRALDPWELDAVMAYLYSIDYKMSDLNFSAEELKKIKLSIQNGDKKSEIITLIKSKYFTASPATFLDPINTSERKMGAEGKPGNGKKIYDQSCLFCHSPGRVTEYLLDNEKLTFKHLLRHLDDNSHFSAYTITRKGTYAKNGYKPYMPNYTLERLSHSQLEDLVAYINQQAKR